MAAGYAIYGPQTMLILTLVATLASGMIWQQWRAIQTEGAERARTQSAWVLAGAWLLRGGVPGWPRIPRLVRVVLGVLALWLTWLAVAQARFIGVNFLLSVLVLVWVADVFAYFAGRTFGLW